MSSPGGGQSLHPGSVSVVIPCKDDAEPLARCLAALEAQTRRADEVIVVDNGSSDDSAATALAFGARALLCPEPGIPAASSTGYDAARGEFILRLDADCLPAPDWIEAVVRAFSEQPGTSAVTGWASFHDGPAALRRVLAALYLGAYTFAGILALGHRPLFGSNLSMRRSAWCAVRSTVHRDDPEMHDDLDLSFHLGERHQIGRLVENRMTMSMRPLSSSAGLRLRMRRGFTTVVAHWPEHLPPYRWHRRRKLGRADLYRVSDISTQL